MNPGIINALNSVAVAALAAKPVDLDAVSVLQSAACAISKIGTAYDGVAYNASASAVLNPNITPFNGQQFDAVQAAIKANPGLTASQLGA